MLLRRSAVAMCLSLVATNVTPSTMPPAKPPKSAVGVISHRISGCDYFVVETKSGYDVLEWFGGHDPDKGDVLIGGYETYSFHDIYDQTAEESLRIWTEDYELSKSDALEKLTDQCE
jgi:hypothetical protein